MAMTKLKLREYLDLKADLILLFVQLMVEAVSVLPVPSTKNAVPNASISSITTFETVCVDPLRVYVIFCGEQEASSIKNVRK